MKKTIEVCYDIYIEELIEKRTFSFFYMEDSCFFFVPFERKIEDLEDIIDVSKEMKSKGINVHDFVLNKDAKILTSVNDQNYVLLRIQGELNQTFDIFDMIDFNSRLIVNPAKNKMYKNDWVNLWSSKVDYFEYQISELGKNKRIVIDSFSYFIGLAENAISYVNDTVINLSMSELDRISLCRKRIKYPNYRGSYMNPLNFIFDLEIRDIAEHIKSTFFFGGDAKSELEIFLKQRELGRFSYQMLYGRLLYPSYYFDLFEDIMNKNEDEKKLISIIEKVDQYEKFLLNTYFMLLKYAQINSIDWLLKKRENI